MITHGLSAFIYIPQVSVNGQHLTTYSHRLNILDAIGVLEITGAAKVVHLRLV